MKKISFQICLILPFFLVFTNSYSQTNSNTANSVIGFFKKKPAPPPPAQPSSQTPPTNATGTTAPVNTTTTADPGAQVPALTSYQNYDFVPGNNILFEDEFTDDESGEFPTHWNLKAGQAILNMQGKDKAFFLTDGNYCRVYPLMKNDSYLTKNFSIEYDYYANGSYAPIIEIDQVQNGDMKIQVTGSEVNWTGYGPGDHSTSLAGQLPADIAGRNFDNKWHHIAITYKNDQMKVYCDQYRILIVPHCNGLAPTNLQIEGIGSQQKPMIIKNFKIADGAQMYMTGQTFTDAKIVTHGINFDINKATIKPESMGTLNMVVRVLNDNPTLKFEVDGHTDNTGTPANNLTLSQQRADAVKAQLITMGVDASRLTTKGFGDSKPMADNSSLEGKANNRRVEFIKL
jgi:OmpA-OmpF porin, OOP family